MNLEALRKLMHKLNHGDDGGGVGKAVSITGWKTELTAVDNPDGELLDVRIERKGNRWWPLGAVGPAQVLRSARRRTRAGVHRTSRRRRHVLAPRFKGKRLNTA